MKNVVIAAALAAQFVAPSASAACLEKFEEAHEWNRTHGQVGEGIGVAAFGTAQGLWVLPPVAIGLELAGAAVYAGSQVYVIRGNRIEKYLELLLAARYDVDGRVIFDDAHRDLDPYYYDAVLDRFTYEVRQSAPGTDRATVVKKIREWDESERFCAKARKPKRFKRARKDLARDIADDSLEPASAPVDGQDDDCEDHGWYR